MRWGLFIAHCSFCLTVHLSPHHWNGARLCRRPAAARGKVEGVGSVLRLVEDDTAALRSMRNSGKADRGLTRDLVAGPGEPGKFGLGTSAAGRNSFVSRIESGQPVQVEEEA